MQEPNEREDSAKRYLLGTLSDEERDRLEERYFIDDAEFEEVEIAEEELIDRYVRGELSQTEEDGFKKQLASSRRLAERVEFAKRLKDKLATSPAPGLGAASPVVVREISAGGRSWWRQLVGFSTESRMPRFATAASVLVVVIGGTVLLVGWLRVREAARQLSAQQAALEQRQRELDQQLAQLKAQAEQARQQNTPQPQPSNTQSPENQIEKPDTPFVRSFAFALSPGATRGRDASHDLRIPAGTNQVQFTLRLREQDYTSYRATMRAVDGPLSLTLDTLRPRSTRSGASLTFHVPATRLVPGDYSISLDGRTPTGTTESVDDYQFRIIK